MPGKGRNKVTPALAAEAAAASSSASSWLQKLLQYLQNPTDFLSPEVLQGLANATVPEMSALLSQLSLELLLASRNSQLVAAFCKGLSIYQDSQAFSIEVGTVEVAILNAAIRHLNAVNFYPISQCYRILNQEILEKKTGLSLSMYLSLRSFLSLSSSLLVERFNAGVAGCQRPEDFFCFLLAKPSYPGSPLYLEDQYKGWVDRRCKREGIKAGKFPEFLATQLDSWPCPEDLYRLVRAFLETEHFRILAPTTWLKAVVRIGDVYLFEAFWHCYPDDAFDCLYRLLSSNFIATDPDIQLLARLIFFLCWSMNARIAIFQRQAIDRQCDFILALVFCLQKSEYYSPSLIQFMSSCAHYQCSGELAKTLLLNNQRLLQILQLISAFSERTFGEDAAQSSLSRSDSLALFQSYPVFQLGQRVCEAISQHLCWLDCQSLRGIPPLLEPVMRRPEPDNRDRKYYKELCRKSAGIPHGRRAIIFDQIMGRFISQEATDTELLLLLAMLEGPPLAGVQPISLQFYSRALSVWGDLPSELGCKGMFLAPIRGSILAATPETYLFHEREVKSSLALIPSMPVANLLLSAELWSGVFSLYHEVQGSDDRCQSVIDLLQKICERIAALGLNLCDLICVTQESRCLYPNLVIMLSHLPSFHSSIEGRHLFALSCALLQSPPPEFFEFVMGLFEKLTIEHTWDTGDSDGFKQSFEIFYASAMQSLPELTLGSEVIQVARTELRALLSLRDAPLFFECLKAKPPRELLKLLFSQFCQDPKTRGILTQSIFNRRQAPLLPPNDIRPALRSIFFMVGKDETLFKTMFGFSGLGLHIKAILAEADQAGAAAFVEAEQSKPEQPEPAKPVPVVPASQPRHTAKPTPVPESPSIPGQRRMTGSGDAQRSRGSASGSEPKKSAAKLQRVAGNGARGGQSSSGSRPKAAKPATASVSSASTSKGATRDPRQQQSARIRSTTQLLQVQDEVKPTPRPPLLAPPPVQKSPDPVVTSVTPSVEVSSAAAMTTQANTEAAPVQLPMARSPLETHGHFAQAATFVPIGVELLSVDVMLEPVDDLFMYYLNCGEAIVSNGHSRCSLRSVFLKIPRDQVESLVEWRGLCELPWAIRTVKFRLFFESSGTRLGLVLRPNVETIPVQLMISAEHPAVSGALRFTLGDASTEVPCEKLAPSSAHHLALRN